MFLSFTRSPAYLLIAFLIAFILPAAMESTDAFAVDTATVSAPVWYTASVGGGVSSWERS